LAQAALNLHAVAGTSENPTHEHSQKFAIGETHRGSEDGNPPSGAQGQSHVGGLRESYISKIREYFCTILVYF